MKLENQVSSLALSQRLKELGVKQFSHFTYHNEFFGEEEVWKLGDAHYQDDGRFKTVPAFTVAELGEMLPMFIGSITAEGEEQPYALLNAWNDMEGWSVAYCPPGGGTMAYHLKVADTEADARAKMLIYLIENKLITS